MGKQPDGAFLFWARDWLTDEHVVLMSPAAKGVYVDLLCHCWLEGSIPACSEHLQRIARIDAHAFDAVWRELAARFAPHPTIAGRLVNRRMDEERAKADERRKSRSDKAAKAAQARWSNAPRNARSSAPRNARSIADASPRAMLPDAHQSNPSTSPLPPETGGGADLQNREARASRAAEPNPEPGTRAKSRDRDDGASPIADLTTALVATRYRGGIANAIVRRSEIRNQAARLHATGLDVADVEALAQLAGEKSNGDPGALLAHWLDGEAWREVLDEQRSKARAQGHRDRGQVAADAAAVPRSIEIAGRGQVLLEHPVYGEEPRLAASIVADVVGAAGASS